MPTIVAKQHALAVRRAATLRQVSLFKSASTVSLLTLVSRITGFARETLIAALFGASHLLLDNMDAGTLRAAVALIAGRVPTEASGGVTLETIRAKAETGVTYISVGRLTQSAPAADIGLDFAQA